MSVQWVGEVLDVRASRKKLDTAPGHQHVSHVQYTWQEVLLNDTHAPNSLYFLPSSLATCCPN